MVSIQYKMGIGGLNSSLRQYVGRVMWNKMENK